MEIRLHPSSTTVSTDMPFKAFARSPNARLGGCMHLDLAAVDAGMAEIRFTSFALVLEQHCRLASVRCACPFSLAMHHPVAHSHCPTDGPKDHLVCAQTLVERSNLTLQSPCPSDNAPPTPPSSIKADMRGMGSQPATLSVSATFPIANTGLSEWIATTAPRTQTNVCITHSLRLHVSLVRLLDGVQSGEEMWELASDVVLVGVSEETQRTCTRPALTNPPDALRTASNRRLYVCQSTRRRPRGPTCSHHPAVIDARLAALSASTCVGL